MRKTVSFISTCIFLLCLSCNSDIDTLSHAQILSNLSKQGKKDPELLVGEWDIIKFSFTADGRKISDVVNITSATLVIPVAPTACCECDNIHGNETGEIITPSVWKLRCSNWSDWACSLSGNLIRLKPCLYTGTYHTQPDEELDVVHALRYAYSFVIKGDVLIIYFIRGEEYGFISIAENKKMNLMILKKH